MTTILSAVILKHQPRGENDLVITAFSKEKGKFFALAKGARKLDAKLRGILEVGNEVKLMLAPGRKQNHIAGGEIINSWKALRGQAETLLLWQSLLEAVNYITVPEAVENEVYELLVNWAEFLQLHYVQDSSRNALISYLVIWQFISLVGYRAEVSICVRSNQNLDAVDNYFSLVDGGVVKKEFTQVGDIPLALVNLKILRYIFHEDFWKRLVDLYRFKLASVEFEQLIVLARAHIRFIMEREINSIIYWQNLYLYGNKIMARIK